MYVSSTSLYTLQGQSQVCFIYCYVSSKPTSKMGLKLNNWNTAEPPTVHSTSPQHTYNLGVTLKARKQGISSFAPLLCPYSITGPLHSGYNQDTSINVLITLHCNWLPRKEIN